MKLTGILQKPSLCDRERFTTAGEKQLFRFPPARSFTSTSEMPDSHG